MPGDFFTSIYDVFGNFKNFVYFTSIYDVIYDGKTLYNSTLNKLDRTQNLGIHVEGPN